MLTLHPSPSHIMQSRRTLKSDQQNKIRYDTVTMHQVKFCLFVGTRCHAHRSNNHHYMRLMRMEKSAIRLARVTAPRSARPCQLEDVVQALDPRPRSQVPRNVATFHLTSAGPFLARASFVWIQPLGKLTTHAMDMPLRCRAPVCTRSAGAGTLFRMSLLIHVVRCVACCMYSTSPLTRGHDAKMSVTLRHHKQALLIVRS